MLDFSCNISSCSSTSVC